MIEEKNEKAIIVVTSLPDENNEKLMQRRRDELDSLCCTLGLEPQACLFFKIRQINSATYIGLGQASIVKAQAEEYGATIVVFNSPVSPRVQRNLEAITGLCVIDRQEVILQIFSDRAFTKEAKLQTELASLQYTLPRLTRKWVNLSQQRGGVRGAKGSGEKQIELDNRRIRLRIEQLKSEIAKIKMQRAVQRQSRQEGLITKIAIAGYTNSGKSTLLNKISAASVLSEDKLFATLDPTTRKVKLPGGSECLFTDTVGFVSDLPHDLVDAFRSTLEEVSNADMLLIVLDISRDDYLLCWETTKEVLLSLDAWDKPRLVVLNKTDLLEEGGEFIINSFRVLEPNIFPISVLNETNFKNLLLKVEETQNQGTEKVTLTLPLGGEAKIAQIRTLSQIIKVKYTDENIVVEVLVKPSLKERVLQYV